MDTKTVAERSEVVIAETIDRLIGIEDALEAIGQQALTRDEYMAMHSPQFRAVAGSHYDHACYRLRKNRTIRKALNDTRRRLAAISK